MQNDIPNPQPEKQANPRIRLPFEKRRIDFGTWVYIRRAGLCATVIAFLIFGIVLVSWKISINDGNAQNAVYIAFDLEKTIEEQLQDQNKELQPTNYSDVANRISNEYSELNANMDEAMGSQESQIHKERGKLNEQMRANREAFEAGIRQQQEMLNSKGSNQTGGEERQQRAKVQGNVTAKYSFSNPVRNDEILDIPAYKCEGGGQVVVNAILDINGYVIATSVDRSQSTSNDCMQREALNSARVSRFNLDTSAPAKHKGTITYVFVPQ